jgi:hypothetical protein
VLRLSSGSCGLAALQQLFEQDTSRLQQTDMLLLEVQLPHPELAASSAGAARNGPALGGKPASKTAAAAAAADAEATQHCRTEATAAATAVAAAAAEDAVAACEGGEVRQSCVADIESTRSAAASGSIAGSSEAGSCSSSTSSEAQSNAETCGSSLDFAAVYNLLYQQYGFVGFMRQQLPCGVVRLGWVRQPARMAARAAVLSSVGDVKLLRQLGL